MRIGGIAALFLLANIGTASTFTPSTALTHVRYASSGLAARASVASNGNGFMAVWQTDRDVRVAPIGFGKSNPGVPIEPWGWSAPVIAAAGDRYVIAANRQEDLETIFVDEGANLIGAAVPVAAGGFAPRIAVFGDRIGIVYTVLLEKRYRLALAVLSRTGVVLAKNIVLPADLVLNGRSPYDIAATASGFAVAVVSAGGTGVLTLDPDGNVVATTSLEALTVGWGSERALHTAIASDGHIYMVLWIASDGTLRATSLSVTGAFLRTVTIAKTTQPISKTTQIPGPTLIGQPSIAFDGSVFVCGYIDGVSLPRLDVVGNGFVTRIEPTLAPIPVPRPVPAGSDIYGIATAAANGSSLVLWADRDNIWVDDGYNIGSGELHAAIVEDEGIVASFVVATAAAEQLTPAAASNGAETLIAWNERTATTNAIYAGILDSAGTWREIGLIAQLQSSAVPLVAASGSDFLIAWSGGAIRLTPDGVRMDGPLVTPLIIPTSAVWDGSRYVIAGGGGRELTIFTIDRSDVVGPPHVVQSAKEGSVFEPMLAWNGTVFLMSFRWQEPTGVNNFFPQEEVHVGILSPAFEVRTESPISPLTSSVSSASVAWNGSEFLAVSRIGSTLNATRISPDGKSLGTVLIRQTEVARPGRASIITEGADFVVAWRDQEDSLKTTPVNDYVAYTPLAVTNHQIVVHSDGSMSDTSVIENAPMTGDLVLVNAAGRSLLISSRTNDEAPYFGASRVTIQTTDVAAIASGPSLTFDYDGPIATLRWSPVVNASEYRVEYRSGTDGWRELDLPQGHATSLSVRLRSSTTKFEFRVRGWSISGTSPYSNTVTLALTRRHAA